MKILHNSVMQRGTGRMEILFNRDSVKDKIHAGAPYGREEK
jgi:hypothetical protein